MTQITYIGFEEWLALPELNLTAIKAKIDTGAQTSALHAFRIEKFEEEGVEKVKFGIHPIPENPDIEIYCIAHLADERKVVSSNGQVELRYIIRTIAKFGKRSWPIEISLTNRETLNYRMLLGRSAMEGRLAVVPDASCLLGELSVDAYENLMTEKHERKLNICILSKDINGYSPSRIASAAEGRGHEVHVLSPERCYAELADEQQSIRYQGHLLSNFDVVIPRIEPTTASYALAILRQFELLGVYCLNSSNALTNSRDKLFTHQLLSRGRIPMPTTAFGNEPSVTKDIIQIVGGAPLIVKLLQSTQGESVVLAETNKAAQAVIQAFRSLAANFIVQEYIQESEGKDIRCLVLGHKVLASMERRAPEGEFRSSTKQGSIAYPVKLTKEERKLVIRAARIVGLRFAAVDIIRSNKGPKVLEINSSPSLEILEKVREMDLAGHIIEYIEHHARPIVTKHFISR